jgi:hypothetical protein
VTKPSDPELHFNSTEMSKDKVKCSGLCGDGTLGVLYAAGIDGASRS